MAHKTPHRLMIEAWLQDPSADDTLSLPYTNASERSKYLSTAIQLKRHDYPISSVEHVPGKVVIKRFGILPPPPPPPPKKPKPIQHKITGYKRAKDGTKLV